MNCKEVENKLIFYVENELSLKDKEAIGEHLKTCSSCNALYRKIKADIDFLHKDKIEQINPVFYQKLEQKIKKSEKEHRKINLKQVYFQVLAYAAAIILAVFIGVALGKDYQVNEELAMDENENLSEFQLFAESYNTEMSLEDTYEVMITDNE
jgi:predicted anti-sigma-YlaC factor YlaD